MKKYSWLITLVIAGYLAVAVITGMWLNNFGQQENQEYKVEINRLLLQMIETDTYEDRIITDKKYVRQVSYISAEQLANGAETSLFGAKNGLNYQIEPIRQGENIVGYAKFYYKTDYDSTEILFAIELILAAAMGITVLILLYLRKNLLKPFQQFSKVPYELAKGHLHGELEESENRFFGRFIWGVSLLQDKLESNRRKELRLEKEKKMMILSISHDIKTPLNNIKLYAKALDEGLYETDEEQKNAIHRIEEKTQEIEHFVSEIVKTSSEDVFDIEIEQGEFYMKELIVQIQHLYEEKCSLKHIDLSMGVYDNKLLKGDIDRTIEVIENIMENAFKYGDGRRIEITFYEEDYSQLLCIHNTGETVTEQEFNHLFDSFYRGGNAQDKEGSGLGLYICKQIMTKMEGDIFAQRCEDGMSFTLVFPL